jgi:2-phosphosulfolactate phosphatase
MAELLRLPVDVCFLPHDLKAEHLSARAVVVFDVLRATTSMTAAFDAGVRSIRIYPSTAEAAAAGQQSRSSLLCGEERCLPPPGFDLGNSPGAFHRSLHAGRDLLMSTTNGTRAIIAARGAAKIFIGALVNAAAVAQRLARENLPVTLLCAGTNGEVAMEDILGAGAVIALLTELVPMSLESDAAQIAQRLFAASRDQLPSTLQLTRGGHNLIVAGLESDINFAARLSVFGSVGSVSVDVPPIVTAV